MINTGAVREWHSEEGWGVIDSAATPGGCWAHFSSLRVSGYRSLDAGQTVSFESEPGPQDGYEFRAVTVWTTSHGPESASNHRAESAGDHEPSAAYRSVLHLEFDDPDGNTPPAGAS